MHRYTHYVIVLGPPGPSSERPNGEKMFLTKGKRKNNRKTKKKYFKVYLIFARGFDT